MPVTTPRPPMFRSALGGLLLLAITIGPWSIDAQAQLTAPLRRFQHTYGTGNNENVSPDSPLESPTHSLERAKDGGYLMVGSTYSNFNVGLDILAFRTSIDGNQVGPMKKITNQGVGTQGTDIHPTSDGGYVILGNRDVEIPVGFSIPGEILVIRVDGSGNTLWSKRYGTYPYREQGFSIQQTSDGGFIVAGYMVDVIDNIGDVFLMKLDGSGNIQWQKAYNNFTWNYAAYAVQQADDGGYIVAGRVRKANFDDNAFLMKVDGNGAYQWYRDFSLTNVDEAFYSVSKTSNGGFIAAGNRGNDMYVVKVNSGGGLDWAKTYDGPEGGVDIAFDVKRTVGDYAVVAGQVNGDMASLMRLKSNGDVDWAKGYAPNGTTTCATSVVISDRGYTIGGEISSNGSDFYMVKTDGAGDSYCNFTTLTMTATAHAGEGNNILLHAMTDKPVTSSPDANSTTIAAIESTLCYNERPWPDVSEATLADQVFIHNFDVGLATDDEGGINDPWNEPVVLVGNAWNAEAIWVRPEQDQEISDRAVGALYANELRHESPDFDAGTNYIYVPINNTGNLATSGGTLEVYWSISSTNLSWPTHWQDYVNGEGITSGGLAGTAVIPAIPAGGIYVAEIEWSTPDAGDFGGTTPGVSFLARYVSAEDPMAFPETFDTEQNAIDNNNIIWRNDIVVSAGDMEPGNEEGGRSIIVRNNLDSEVETALTFSIPTAERGINPLFEEADVFVDLGAELYARWGESGELGSNIEDNGDGLIRITGDGATIEGLPLSSGEEFPVAVRFEYHGEELPYPQYYHYDVTQAGGIGGVTFQLRFPAAAPEEGPSKTVAPGALSAAERMGITLDAHPNPAHSSATITFELPSEMRSQLAIYDITGELVRLLIPERTMAEGTHSIRWDGADAAGRPVGSGLYLYRLETPAGVINRQMRIVR